MVIKDVQTSAIVLAVLILSIHGNASETQEGLASKQIQKVISTHLNSILKCYEKRLEENPKLSGDVKVNFQIEPSGVVKIAKIKNSELNDSEAEACILGAIRALKFPKPTGGATVSVDYPFRFKQVKTK